MVLFRDRNGWCPYSERVWLAMLEKRLSFDEVLINLQVLTGIFTQAISVRRRRANTLHLQT
jgi:glutathione S-transferase